MACLTTLSARVWAVMALLIRFLTLLCTSTRITKLNRGWCELYICEYVRGFDRDAVTMINREIEIKGTLSKWLASISECNECKLSSFSSSSFLVSSFIIAFWFENKLLLWQQDIIWLLQFALNSSVFLPAGRVHWDMFLFSFPQFENGPFLLCLISSSLYSHTRGRHINCQNRVQNN